MTTAWNILIDWEGTGTFTDEGDRLLDLSINRGRESRLSSDGYTMVSPGSFSLTLENYDQRYNTFNTLSPLYGYIKPHRTIKIIAVDSSQNFNTITGWIRDIRPQENRSKVRITGYDGIDWLQSQKAPQLDLETDYGVTDAIVTLLTAAGWPYSDTSGWILGTSQLGIDNYLGSSLIESSGDILPYWWGDPDKSIWESITDLAEAYFGNPYVSSDGTFAYKSRNDLDPVKYSITQSEILRDIDLQQPWDELRNDIRITGYPRQETEADTELWKLNYTPAIAAGETITVWAEHNYNGDQCPALSITTLAATTDYTANTVADGSGTDKTAQISTNQTAYATRTKLEVTNNDPSAVYLTLLRIRGIGLFSHSGVLAMESDTASINNYGRYTLSLGSIWLQKTEDINNHAGLAIGVFTDPRNILWVRMTGRPTYQLPVDLFDKINITIDQLSISGNYIITSINHSWKAGSSLLTTVRLEPSIGNGWLLGYSQLGIDNILGW